LLKKPNNKINFYYFVHRDNEEWLKHRTILNNFLLKDVRWMTQPIETNCDLLINYIKNNQPPGTRKNHDFYEIPDLEKQLYQLSIEGDYNY
jgi:hypothetical protein